MKSRHLYLVARLLGGESYGPNAVLCPGPSHSDRDRSLKVTFLPNGGFVVHSFAGDDWRTCRAHVEWVLNRFEHRQTPPLGSSFLREAEEKARRIARAMKIWEAAGPPGSAIHNYLEQRHLELPATLTDGAAIRFHASCPFRLEDGTIAALPAMVCLFRDLVTDAPVGIHRTALEPDGHGKSKRFKCASSCRQMLGRASGAAIKLAADFGVTTGLAISEGVENAITAICGGLGPVWALGSAGFVRSFQVLNGIESLTILADHDVVGLDAARTCARRWADSGRVVWITYPRTVGADWNAIRAAP